MKPDTQPHRGYEGWPDFRPKRRPSRPPRARRPVPRTGGLPPPPPPGGSATWFGWINKGLRFIPKLEFGRQILRPTALNDYDLSNPMIRNALYTADGYWEPSRIEPVGGGFSLVNPLPDMWAVVPTAEAVPLSKPDRWRPVSVDTGMPPQEFLPKVRSMRRSPLLESLLLAPSADPVTPVFKFSPAPANWDWTAPEFYPLGESSPFSRNQVVRDLWREIDQQMRDLSRSNRDLFERIRRETEIEMAVKQAQRAERELVRSLEEARIEQASRQKRAIAHGEAVRDRFRDRDDDAKIKGRTPDLVRMIMGMLRAYEEADDLAAIAMLWSSSFYAADAGVYVDAQQILENSSDLRVGIDNLMEVAGRSDLTFDYKHFAKGMATWALGEYAGSIQGDTSTQSGRLRSYSFDAKRNQVSFEETWREVHGWLL